ncbi:hypothetical protein [Paraburkholderia rhizosphaerae]|uniref:Lipoprotein n=1 Tax=Paraburkholderia rhizosphaerae TaxID=480658 RepID=A0A4R8M0F0_9BURK|nr:hypothetical protein [Paraburkholderia rhizosphaerae]TDY53336.1 hypothetical protein BX592_103147 [Paraburkholderia rhizosphaerae]
MRGIWMIGAATLVAGCVSTPSLTGTRGAPSFEALQQMCGPQTVDYGQDAQSVYVAFFDAFVAYRRGRLTQDNFCGFQQSIAKQYTQYGTSSDPELRNRWVAFFNEQRALAITWRSAVDPTLRSG